MATATVASAAILAFFCLCLNLGFSQTIAPAVAATNRTSSSAKVVRLELIPRDSPLAATSNRSASFLRGLTESDRLRRAVRRSHARAATIQRRLRALADLGQDKAGVQPGGYELPMTKSSVTYVTKLSIGSQSLQYLAVVDTGSDLIWTQCLPCVTCFHQDTPIFDPSNSQTYTTCAYDSPACRMLPPNHSSRGSNNECKYKYGYADSSGTEGVLSTESFSVSGAPFPDVVFGCGHKNTGNSLHGFGGIIGFGRGELSLPSQFASSVGSQDATFGYCLTSSTSENSPMWLGPDATSKFPSGVLRRSTPLLLNPFMTTHYHYVSLTAIDVAHIPVPIPSGAFDFRPDGSGGLILDSGTTISYLETRTYNNLVGVLTSRIKIDPVDGSSVRMRLCFDASEVQSRNILFPRVTLTFQGGAKLYWLPNHYLMHINNFLCASLAPAPQVSILGSYGLLNYFMLHDTALNKLDFAPADCKSL